MFAQAQVQDKVHVASQGELACGLYTLQHLSMKQVYLSVYARKNEVSVYLWQIWLLVVSKNNIQNVFQSTKKHILQLILCHPL